MTSQETNIPERNPDPIPQNPLTFTREKENTFSVMKFEGNTRGKLKILTEITFAGICDEIDTME